MTSGRYKVMQGEQQIPNWEAQCCECQKKS